jgi:hypothetical protein
MRRDAMLGAVLASFRPLAVAFFVAFVVVGCSSSDGDDVADTTSTEAPTTTAAPPPTAVLTEEVGVDAAFRQGVARTDDGWIFSVNQGLYRTDDALTRVVENDAAIPADLMAEGYDHLGDPDIADGILYVPLEQPDKERREQRMIWYDVATLEPIDSAPVPQAHAAWISVDDGVAYSMNEFDGDDTILRYDVETWEPLEPLVMSRSLDRVQGGDVADGYLWLSTDDATDGLYRVDLDTGQVDTVGALGHPDGEGEGIDATDLPSGELHALSIDASLVPVWFEHFRLED